MLSTKLLIVFALLTGIFVDQCDLGDLNIAEVADKVVVTNASSGGDALVMVAFNHNEVSWHVPAGTSKTASGLAATKYTVSVLAPSSSMWVNYQERLEMARDDLVAITLDPTAKPEAIADAAAQLPLVVEALRQLRGSKVVQSCAAKIATGVPGRATVEYTKAADGIGFWTLDCS